MRRAYTLAVLLLGVTLLSGLYTGPSLRIPPVHAASGPATLQVWSPQYGNNITSLTNLQVGQTFDVKINVTNAGPISGYDVSLNYNLTSALPNTIQAVKTGLESSGTLFDPSYDWKGNTGQDCQTNMLKNEIDLPPGKIRFYGQIYGGCTVDGNNGTLFTLRFKVIGQGSAAIDFVRGFGSGESLASKVIGAPPTVREVPLQISGANFRNTSGLSPIASFTYLPASPFKGHDVTFNGTASYDPDQPSAPNKGITKFIWDFGDGTGAGGSYQIHRFMYNPATPAQGYFDIRLVVIDSDQNLASRQISTIYVSPGKIHHLAVTMDIDRPQPTVGDSLKISVAVSNRGNQDERAGLNVTYESQGIQFLGQEKDFSVLVLAAAQLFSYTLQTSNLAPRIYTITASVKILGLPSNETDASGSDSTYTKSFQLNPTKTGAFELSIPLLAGGAVAVIAVAVGALQIMRRRRKDTDALPE